MCAVIWYFTEKLYNSVLLAHARPTMFWHTLVGWVELVEARDTIVSSPDQIFRVRHADSSKNRVRTLSVRKLGHVYIWRSVNWVLITLSATSSICLGAKKIASWLFVMTHNTIYFTSAIRLVRQHANMLVWLHPSFLPVNVSKFNPIFQQGRRPRAKN